MGVFAMVCGMSGGAWSLNSRYMVGINATFSMPEPAMFLVDRRGWEPDDAPQRGHYVALRWKGGGPWPAGAIFVKRVLGVPGDDVSVKDRVVFINGVAVARAKAHAQDGTALEPIVAQRIAPGHYYLHNDGPDSLDSRYALAGLPLRESIIGPAIVWKLGSRGCGLTVGR